MEVAVAVNIKCSFFPQSSTINFPVCVFQGIDLLRNRDSRVDISNSLEENNLTREIVIRNSNLEFFPRGIRSTFPNLERIVLEYLRLERIDRNFFSVPYRTVKYLKVQGNPSDKTLKVLKSDTFHLFPMLEEIDFSYNKISTLEPYLLRNLWMLKEISFKGNEIENLDENFISSNRNLEKVDFSENMISSLSPNIFKSSVNLKHVDFGWNRLSELPDKLFEYNDNLELIDFKYNVISKIYPTAFNNLDKVKRIDFDKNICVDGSFVPRGDFDRDLFDTGMVVCYQNCKTCGKNE